MSRCICVLLLLAILLPASVAVAQPESVPPMTQRPLDSADYKELVRQWKTYIEEHGETAEALVNLGMAYDYIGEREAAVEKARRAIELDADNPKALAFLGKMLAVWEDDGSAALVHLRRCREIAPDYAPGLNMLAGTYLRRGEFGRADEVFETMFRQETIARPLQDFAYNLLAGLPPDVLLITSGDNDTYPVLALQAGMDFRRDVQVLNRSLLNLPEYAEAIFSCHEKIRPAVNLDNHEVKKEGGRITTLSSVILQSLIGESKVPVYFAPTAFYEQHGYEPKGEIEGVNLRASGPAMPAEDAAQLFFDVYRLDSATDWNFSWKLMPSIRDLMRNYVAAICRTADQSGLSSQVRKSLLDKAERIAKFHGMEHMLSSIEILRKK